MFNVVVKTALKTLLGVIIALLLAFAIASLGFPGSMASLFENWGNYSLATGYASLSYSYSGNAEDLARCFQDSVLAGNDGDIVRYGEELYAHKDFADVCESKNEQLGTISGKVKIEYKQYVYGSVACAKYNQDGIKSAIETANAAMDDIVGFPENNALAQLALRVISKADVDGAAELLKEIEKHHTDSIYYQAVKEQLLKIANS